MQCYIEPSLQPNPLDKQLCSLQMVKCVTLELFGSAKSSVYDFFFHMERPGDYPSETMRRRIQRSIVRHLLLYEDT